MAESGAATANPLDTAGAADVGATGAGAAFAPAAVDEIDIEAGLKDGTLSPAEAIVQEVHRQLAVQERALAGVEAPLVEALVRKVLGRGRACH
jgi:hypothetical protein